MHGADQDGHAHAGSVLGSTARHVSTDAIAQAATRLPSQHAAGVFHFVGKSDRPCSRRACDVTNSLRPSHASAACAVRANNSSFDVTAASKPGPGLSYRRKRQAIEWNAGLGGPGFAAASI
jgi:hypothetical protein